MVSRPDHWSRTGSRRRWPTGGSCAPSTSLACSKASPAAVRRGTSRWRCIHSADPARGMATCTISGPLTCPKWSFGSTRDVRPTRPTRPESGHPEPCAPDDRAGRRWTRALATIHVPAAACRGGPDADADGDIDDGAGLIGHAERDDVAVGWPDIVARCIRLPVAVRECDTDGDGGSPDFRNADARADRDRHAGGPPADTDTARYADRDRPPGAAPDSHASTDCGADHAADTCAHAPTDRSPDSAPADATDAESDSASDGPADTCAHAPADGAADLQTDPRTDAEADPETDAATDGARPQPAEDGEGAPALSDQVGSATRSFEGRR